MICIACSKDHEKLASSHVISNFVRKRLAGIIREDGSKQYFFRWISQPKLPKQDLPKPALMCRECDSALGALVENEIAVLIMPSDVNVYAEWAKLPLSSVPIKGVFDSDFFLGVYNYQPERQWRIEKFALLTAWRALHAMHKDGLPLSTEFLESPRGGQINQHVLDHLFRNKKIEFGARAAFYYWSPYSVSVITGKDDEMPFAWTELGVAGEFLGVAVMFGYWVVVWPLFECEPDQVQEKLELLNRSCFLHWAAHVMKLLS
jgi:hypothetical protein